mmetsp:Transcript_14433/g.38284  ORF Transcript_14433/g.38284 Transcript_14433/m.38284 type:complete len:331 (+) Transcript_14433:62-1054(+)
MAPKGSGKGAAKGAGKGAKRAPRVTYDYSDLKEGLKVQAEADGEYFAATIVTVSDAKGKAKAPVKVNFTGYAASEDKWVGGDRLRSKALKIVKPEVPEAEKRPPLEINFGYWKIRGLGAIFRMIFEYKGVKYTDNQYATGEEWFGADKPKILEKNPLANLPYIECGKDCVCQTNAILVYLGQKLRLDGGGYKARIQNEELLCEIYDVRNQILELSYPFKEVCRTDAEHSAKAAKQLEAGPFKKFEAVLEKNGTEFFCGKTLAVCDFHIWEMMDQHRLLAEKHSKGDIFADIPKCKAFYDKFRALPKLEKYFASESYKLPVNNPIANAYFQ